MGREDPGSSRGSFCSISGATRFGMRSSRGRGFFSTSAATPSDLEGAADFVEGVAMVAHDARRPSETLPSSSASPMLHEPAASPHRGQLADSHTSYKRARV